MKTKNEIRSEIQNIIRDGMVRDKEPSDAISDYILTAIEDGGGRSQASPYDLTQSQFESFKNGRITALKEIVIELVKIFPQCAGGGYDPMSTNDCGNKISALLNEITVLNNSYFIKTIEADRTEAKQESKLI